MQARLMLIFALKGCAKRTLPGPLGGASHFVLPPANFCEFGFALAFSEIATKPNQRHSLGSPIHSPRWTLGIGLDPRPRSLVHRDSPAHACMSAGLDVQLDVRFTP